MIKCKTFKSVLPPYHILYVSIECRGTTLSHVLVDTDSSLNVLPKKALDRLDCEGLTLKPNNIVVRAFDSSKRMVHGEVDIPIKVGTQTFNSTFYVMDILPSYSCLLGGHWIHRDGACCTPKFSLPYSSRNCQVMLQNSPRVAQCKGLLNSQN